MGKITIRRLGYALGAAVTGFDMRADLDDRTIAEIRRAWLDHIVLCFPGHDIGPHELMAFAGRFGELDDMRRTPENRHPDHPPVAMFSNKPVVVNGKPTGGLPYGQQWHSDRQTTFYPATASFLAALELPDVGGDTMFANMYEAYETLSPAMRRLIDPLQAVHDIGLSRNLTHKPPEIQAARRRNARVVHPVVRVHPETGRKALFVSAYVRQFEGMTEDESKPLLDFLNRHATRYEFIYRHRWAPNDVLMWDNRCAIHHAVPDYDPAQLRRMMRCALIAPRSGRLFAEDVERGASTVAS